MNFKSTYIVMTIRKFGEYFKLSPRESYDYLKRYSGIAYLDDCFEAEHQLSFEDAISDLARVCNLHGGNLKYD